MKFAHIHLHTALAALVLVRVVVMVAVMAPAATVLLRLVRMATLLELVLRFAADKGTCKRADDSMTAVLVAYVMPADTARNGSHDASVAFSCLRWIRGSILLLRIWVIGVGWALTVCALIWKL